MGRKKQDKNGAIKELTAEEGRELFDNAARYYLNMSGDEFIRKWNAGEFDSIIDDPEHHSTLMHLAMLRHFARKSTQ